MRFATLKDGRLVLVSSTGLQAVDTAPIAASLLDALQNWDAVAPALRERTAALEAGTATGIFAFDPAACSAPCRAARSGWMHRRSSTMAA